MKYYFFVFRTKNCRDLAIIARRATPVGRHATDGVTRLYVTLFVSRRNRTETRKKDRQKRLVNVSIAWWAHVVNVKIDVTRVAARSAYQCMADQTIFLENAVALIDAIVRARTGRNTLQNGLLLGRSDGRGGSLITRRVTNNLSRTCFLVRRVRGNTGTVRRAARPRFDETRTHACAQ